jgi:hypothetical protein
MKAVLMAFVMTIRASSDIWVPHRILRLKPALRLERRGQHGQHKTNKRDHRANLADSSLNKPGLDFRYTHGPLSQWLFSALAEAELPAVCVETRHMQAVLKAQINKTDRNDARGIAQMIRVGLCRPVHVKTLRSQKLRMLLTHRKLLQSKAIAIENDLRGTLRNFGLKVGMVGKVRFETRIQELVENFPDLVILNSPGSAPPTAPLPRRRSAICRLLAQLQADPDW